MLSKLYLHQELMLLAISDREGTFAGGMFLYAISGAMVSELLLSEKIAVADDKRQLVAVVDQTTTGDVLLDELLQQIQDAKKPKALKDWVYAAANIKDLKHRVAEQLCELGILKQDEKKILWIFTQKVYPEVNGAVEDAVRARMAKVMFNPDVEPDAETIVLISLSSHTKLLDRNFPKEELVQHKERIEQLAKGDILATGATQVAIQAVQTAILVATIVPAMMAATTAAAASN